MKYYVEQLQKHLDKMFTTLAATLAEVDSPEFEARVKERYEQYGTNNHQILMATKLAWVQTTAGQVARDTMVPWYFTQLLPEVTYAERLVRLCEELGIDESHLTALELLTTNERYRHECSGLREEIAKAVEEVVSDDREREQDEAITALTAAGFAYDDEADSYRRGNFAVTITWDRKRCLYKWLLGDGNNNFRDGESGSFGHLLQHVGIVKQEVAQ